MASTTSEIEYDTASIEFPSGNVDKALDVLGLGVASQAWKEQADGCSRAKILIWLDPIQADFAAIKQFVDFSFVFDFWNGSSYQARKDSLQSGFKTPNGWLVNFVENGHGFLEHVHERTGGFAMQADRFHHQNLVVDVDSDECNHHWLDQWVLFKESEKSDWFSIQIMGLFFKSYLRHAEHNADNIFWPLLDLVQHFTDYNSQLLSTTKWTLDFDLDK